MMVAISGTGTSHSSEYLCSSPVLMGFLLLNL